MSESRASIRIAMWSGPRNISTAMMRAWGNRSDTAVVDEPFYGFYLQTTGKDHPGAKEVVAQTETDSSKVIAQLVGPIPNDRRIFYQKQMTHHLLPSVDRAWLRQVTNCFLIRDPAEVIASYIKKNDVDLALEDLGFVQQLEIFGLVRQTNAAPPVIDAREALENPRKTLGLLCEAVGVEFDEAMLSWPAGLRETDGRWAKHWYDEVARSTSFQPAKAKQISVPQELRGIYERCRECYDQLYADRLR
ncbi:MAG: HAD family hydrolase [Spartobacteria bacterium]